MIRYIKHQAIDKSKWDRCMDESFYSIIYGYSWYLDIVSPGWDALIDDDYLAVFPLTWKRKYGICYLTQPLFAQQLGVFSRLPVSNKRLMEFLKAIPSRFLHLDINMNPVNTLDNSLASTGFRLRKTYHLFLNKAYRKISENYSGDTKRNLHVARKSALQIHEIPVEAVIEIYKQQVWHKTPALTEKDFSNLQYLTEVVATRKKIISVGAFEQDKLNAGTLFFICGEKIIFILGAASKAGRRHGAMRSVFDYLIRHYCNTGKVLDFEGSSIPSVEYFYKGFGSERITFYNVNASHTLILGGLIDVKQKITKAIARQKINKLFPHEC